MTEELERDAVIRWIRNVLGWELAKTIPATKGRTMYIFHEPDSGGWSIERKFRADQLRWRYMQPIAFEHVPALREQAEAIWQDYLGARSPDFRPPARGEPDARLPVCAVPWADDARQGDTHEQ